MDNSFGASTSVLHTPSPLTRKPLYPDLSSSRPSPSSAAPLTTRNVRFTDQHTTTTTTTTQLSPQRPTYNSFGSSSAPPSRVQSYTGHSPPHRLPVQRSPSSSGGMVAGSVAVHNVAAYASPVKRVAQLALPAVKKVESLVHLPQKPEVVKRKATPMGRGEAAKRLRVNSVLLVCWWLSSRTDVYKTLAGHLVQLVPSLDMPLHLFESLLALVLCYNIIDSMRYLNRLSSLPAPAPTSPTPTTSAPSTPTRLSTPTQPHLHTPTYSSPKTRPSPSTPTSSSTPLFRSSSLGSPTPPSPQTPSSLSRSASAVLRRSFVGTPGGSPGGSPLGRSVSVGGGDAEKGGLVAAFRARHSPVASKLSVNSSEAIDRLFES